MGHYLPIAIFGSSKGSQESKTAAKKAIEIMLACNKDVALFTVPQQHRYGLENYIIEAFEGRIEIHVPKISRTFFPFFKTGFSSNFRYKIITDLIRIVDIVILELASDKSNGNIALKVAKRGLVPYIDLSSEKDRKKIERCHQRTHTTKEENHVPF